jgi:hypothetical protein
MMDSSENKTASNLHQLVVIGMTLLFFSSLFSFLTSPAQNHLNFPSSHPVAFLRIIVLVSLLCGLFILSKVDKHRSWARRLIIAGFILGLPSTPSNLSAMKAQYPGHPILLSVELGIIALSFLYSLVLSGYLFRPDVRLLFISTPPKLSRQIIFGVMLFSLGFVNPTLKRFQKFAEQQSAQIPPKLRTAQALATIKLPDWGEIGEARRFWQSLNAVDSPQFSLRSTIQKFVWPRRGFAVVPYLAPGTKLRILLFIPDEGADGRLELMLLAIDRAVRIGQIADQGWSTRTIPNLGSWVALKPTIVGQKSIFVHTKVLSIQELSFPSLPGYKGELVGFVKDDLSIAVLAYQAGSFDEPRFNEFLRALTP